ncbi:MAG: hypothetical protein COA78_16840 [Blastopirellula sp.]|nr:MAG: hypothetical protein COA78_16840 [Blastopirellula sp.]
MLAALRKIGATGSFGLRNLAGSWEIVTMNTGRQSFSGELLVLVILFAFTTAYLLDALNLGSPLRYGLPSASFMPIILSVIMYVCIGIIALQNGRKALRENLQTNFLREISEYRTPALVVLSTAIFVYFFVSLGFEISVLAYVYSVLWLLGFPAVESSTLTKIAKRALVSAVISTGVYAFFVIAFGVKLPTTWATFL